MEILTKLYFHNLKVYAHVCWIKRNEIWGQQTVAVLALKLSWNGKQISHSIFYIFFSFAHVSALNDIFFFLLIHLAQIFKRWSWLENFVQPFYMVGWTSKGCSMKSEWQGGRHILYYDDRPKRLTVLEELLFLCDTITKCHLIGRAYIQQQHFVLNQIRLGSFREFPKTQTKL